MRRKEYRLKKLQEARKVLEQEKVEKVNVTVERKLFATGDSLAVTLPKAWINYFRLKAGDSVVMVANNEVTIRIKSPEENIDPKTT